MASAWSVSSFIKAYTLIPRNTPPACERPPGDGSNRLCGHRWLPLSLCSMRPRARSSFVLAKPNLLHLVVVGYYNLCRPSSPVETCHFSVNMKRFPGDSSDSSRRHRRPFCFSAAVCVVCAPLFSTLNTKIPSLLKSIVARSINHQRTCHERDTRCLFLGFLT